MTTQEIQDSYAKLLEEVDELTKQLFRIGFQLNDLAYFGHSATTIRNEWEQYNMIEHALDSLHRELLKVIGEGEGTPE